MLPDTDIMGFAAVTQLFEELRKQLVTSFATLKCINHVDRISPSLLVSHNDDEIEFPISIVPRARTQAIFCGRKRTLASIEEHFTANPSSTSLLSVLLHGTEGVGKTETAHERSHYDVVLWIQCDTPLSLTSSMAEIAKRLSFPGSESPGSDESNLNNFHKWMNKQALQSKGSLPLRNGPHDGHLRLTCTEERRCLLNYDDVEAIDDNLKRYIPTTPGNTIITSRNRHAVYPGTKLFPLKPFSVADGGVLLRQLLQFPNIQVQTQEDIDAITSLAHMVEGLPLGIRLMAGLINEREGESTSSFMKEYAQSPRCTLTAAPRAIGYAKDEHRDLDGDEHPLDRIWTTASNRFHHPGWL